MALTWDYRPDTRTLNISGTNWSIDVTELTDLKELFDNLDLIFG